MAGNVCGNVDIEDDCVDRRPLHYAKVAMGSRRFDLGWPGSGIGPGTDMPKKSHQQELLPLQTFWINI